MNPLPHRYGLNSMANRFCPFVSDGRFSRRASTELKSNMKRDVLRLFRLYKAHDCCYGFNICSALIDQINYHSWNNIFFIVCVRIFNYKSVLFFSRMFYWMWFKKHFPLIFISISYCSVKAVRKLVN